MTFEECALWIHDFCSDKQWPPWFIQPIPGQDFTILQYVAHVFCSHSTVCGCHRVIHRKRLARDELKATFD